MFASMYVCAPDACLVPGTGVSETHVGIRDGTLIL